MPIYTYRCKCDNVFELEQPYFTIATPECPKCGKKEVDKIITPPTITRVREIRTVGQQGEKNYKRDKNKIKEVSQMRKENGKKEN